jgi:hypothetical protein
VLAARSSAGNAAGSSQLPDLSGTWSLVEHWDNAPRSSPYYAVAATYPFVRTGPDTYTVSNGAGWTTTDVTIAGDSATIWTCGNGGTYSQKDRAACPTASGYWTESWKFDLTSGADYTATGTGQEHLGNGSTTGEHSITFVATGPARPAASLSVAVSVAKSRIGVGDEVGATVKVTALGGDVSKVSLGRGLVPLTKAASISKAPTGLSGFDLAKGTSRSFTFTVKGAQSGATVLSVNATGESSSGAVSGSGAARLQVGEENLGIDWTMPSRLIPDGSDWKGDDGLPPPSYVSPDTWTVDLFLTSGGAKNCPADVTFDWTVTGEGKSESLGDHGCTATALVAKLGVYKVTAKELKDGVATGTEAANDRVVIRNWLLVGLGDSNGSGQGNPPYFLNARCDRSTTSYQFQTALYIEDHDPRSSVTFVFDACSGARSDQLWLNSYAGQEPSGGVMLPPQIDQVKSVIGDRKPDAVIMSVGINDLYFGPIMSFCATHFQALPTLPGPLADCENANVTPTADPLGYTTGYNLSTSARDATVAARTAERLNVLPGRLASLSNHLSSLGAAHVFATEYPDESTDQNGKLCNDNGPFPKLPSGVWGWLQQTGDALNRVVDGTTSLGWIPVTGVAAGFIGHGYCSTDSYFDTPTRSQWEQADRNGAFHARAPGAAVTFALTRDAVCERLYGNAACDGIPPAPK